MIDIGSMQLPTFPTLTIDGKTYVVVPEPEFERLRSLAKAGSDSDGPPLPPANRDGTFPAVEYARASLARKIIRRRRAVGLSQEELARQAGVRVQTLERFERGTASPNVRTVDKIDRALKAAEAGR